MAILASALVIGQRNPMYSVLMLIASFGALAGLYIQLDAPFVAVAQIIIYAGAIMVLFLFVVMLLNAPQEDAAEWDRTHPLRRTGITRFGGLLALLLVVELAWALLQVNDVDVPVGAQGDPEALGSVRALGRILFTDYVFAFEATSILILVAMVGAVLLARREGDG
jgi:NADH-quinone oxidoreductase subunit J